ncbi:MAG: TonB-dependent receptor [Porticoccaceae bacterium]
MKNIFYKSILRAGLVPMTGIVGFMPSVLAQTTEEAGRTSRLEEIIVTAQRREESLQSVPISITALTGDTLSKSGIQDTNDLAVATSGLVMQVARTTVQPFLRGVGTNSNSIGVENANAIYVDGVYIADLAAATFSLNNIDRIEVLKGPQGTLFGRNATGGLIHVITKKPSYEFTGNARLGYANYDTSTGSFYVTGGLTDNIAADLSGYFSNQGEGWGKSLTTGLDVNKKRESMVRGKVLIEASEQTTITLAGDYTEVDTDVATTRQVVPGSLLVGGVAFQGSIHDSSLGMLDSGSNVEQYGGSVRVDHNFNNGLELMSLTAYREMTTYSRQDQDGTAADIVDGTINEEAHTFTQELHLLGNHGRFNWVTGVYFLEADAGYTPLAIKGLGIANGTALQEIFRKQDTRSIAGFAQTTIEIFPDTNLTLGGRYTRDEREASGGIHVTPFATGVTTVIPLSDEVTSNKFTYRVALDHKLTDNTLIYASQSRGFKSGLYNLPTASTTPVKPETLDATEIGIKSDLLDDRLRINAAAYYYDYKDIHLARVVPGGSELLNAAEAEIYGLDLDLTVAPTDNFLLTAAITLLDTEYTSFPDGPFTVPQAGGGNSTIAVDLSGNEMIKAPKWTMSLNADFTQELAGGELRLNGNIHRNDGFYWEPDHRIKEDGYTLVNAQVAWTTPSDAVTFTFWGRNLTNKGYAITVSQSALGDQLGAGAPRTYGVSLETRF